MTLQADNSDDMSEELDVMPEILLKRTRGKFESLGSVLKGVGVAMGAVVTKLPLPPQFLGKAVVEITQNMSSWSAVSIRCLGTSATLQEYANNAYKTAGMSANDYMSTVFHLFLPPYISSLGGDTEAAVKYADIGHYGYGG